MKRILQVCMGDAGVVVGTLYQRKPHETTATKTANLTAAKY